MDGDKPAGKPAEDVAGRSQGKSETESAGKAGRAGAGGSERKPPEKKLPPDRRRLLRFGVLGLAILIGVIAWVATSGGDDSSSTPEPAEAAPRIVSEAELAETAASAGQPIYWAGPQAGTELELTEVEGAGGYQVHYLPEGTDPEEAKPGVLTIGSYPLANPAKAVEGFAGRPGAIVRHAKNGLEVVSSQERPTSVYFASPDNSVQVEVYDPSAKKAMSLALSGKVGPAQ